MKKNNNTLGTAAALFIAATALLGGCTGQNSRGGIEIIDLYRYEDGGALTDAMLDSLATETRVIGLVADGDLTIPANPIKVKFAGDVTGTDGPAQDTGSNKTESRIEDRIYVLDNPAIREYRLLAFDSNGRFIRQIGAMGRGPGEYLGISDFATAPDGSVWIEDAVANNLIHYGKDLRHICTVPTSYDADCMEFLEDGNLIVNLSHWNPDLIRIAVTDTLFGEENRRTVIRYNYEPNPYVHYGSGQLNKVREGWLHNYPPFGDIYLFDSRDGELKQHCFLDFGPDKITPEDVLEVGDDGMRFVQLMDDHAFLLMIADLSDDYVIGRMNDKKKYDTDFIADRKNRIIYKSKPGSPSRILGQSGEWTVSLVTPDTDEARYRLILRRFQ